MYEILIGLNLCNGLNLPSGFHHSSAILENFSISFLFFSLILPLSLRSSFIFFKGVRYSVSFLSGFKASLKFFAFNSASFSFAIRPVSSELKSPLIRFFASKSASAIANSAMPIFPSSNFIISSRMNVAVPSPTAFKFLLIAAISCRTHLQCR